MTKKRYFRGSTSTEINPSVITALEKDRPIKTFYSVIREIKEKGESVIDVASSVEVDEIDMKVISAVVKEGHRESLKLGHYTEYPFSWGLPRLRESIANVFKRAAGINLNNLKEVMVTGGIVRAIDTAIQSLDITHVVIPSLAPYFARSLALLRGKSLIEVSLDLKTGNFDLTTLEKKMVKQRVKKGKVLMYMTLPSAPAGTLPDEGFIEDELIPFAKRFNMPIISDTYVFATTYSTKRIRPLMSYLGSREVAVEAITVSKELGLPGIRIGGCVGNPEIINAMKVYTACSLEMLPTANQNIAAIALDKINPRPIGLRLKKSLAKEILPRFKKMNWPVIIPEAGLEMLVEIPKGFQEMNVADHSLLASLSLLLQYQVAFCPASVFGKDGDKYLRIVIKQKESKISNALDRLTDLGFDWKREKPSDGIVSRVNGLMEKLDLTRL